MLPGTGWHARWTVSESVSISQAKLGCRDPDHDKLLETALLGDATCIVTGNHDLLAMRPFRGVPIHDPGAVLRATGPDSAQPYGPA